MGTAVMGGTAAASLIAVFLIPVTFYVVGKIAGPPKRRGGQKETGKDHEAGGQGTIDNGRDGSDTQGGDHA
jgi:hypothetical protein